MDHLAHAEGRPSADALYAVLLQAYGALQYEKVRSVAELCSGKDFLGCLWGKNLTDFSILLQEAAKEEELRLPRDSMFHMMHIRCAVSGRSRGLLKKYRLSRLVWRNLADNNKLSGVIKASW